MRNIISVLILLCIAFLSISARNGCLSFLDDSGSSGLYAPGNLRVTNISTAQIDLQWNGDGNVTGYKIERSINGVDFIQIGTVAGTWVSPDYAYSDATVTTATMTYYYRVRGFNNRGNSDYSNVLRASLNGGLLSSFGTNGVVNSNPTDIYDGANDIAIDSQYMYVVGIERSNGYGDWRIEKRNLSDGTFNTGFGIQGVITSSVSGGPRALAIDSTYMYVAGSGGGTGWRIEKRILSNGVLDTNFGSGGVVSSTGSAYALAIDSQYMYVAGHDFYVSEQWLIEKRNLSDGTLVTAFGSGGVITSVGSPAKIVIDSTYMYVAGFNITPGNQQWLIEKRSLSNGTLVTGFGAGGVITNNPSSGNDEATSITVDSSYMYVAGFDRVSDTEQWRIEKRNLSDGTLVAGFGIGGVISSNLSNSGPGYERINSLTIDPNYIYVSGVSTNDLSGADDLRMEKRNLSNGTLVNDFGTDGMVIGKYYGYLLGMSIDSAYIYAVGFDRPSGGSDNAQWRIEKRLK